MSPVPDMTTLRRRHASLDAYAGTRLVTLEDGPARGLRIIEMRSGGGLDAEIVVDRTFDIGRLAQDGETLSWHTPNGDRHPALIDSQGDGGQGYLRGLSGFLSTCGFDHIRQPETLPARDLPLYPGDQIAYPLHGHGAQQPARLIGHGLSEEGPTPYLWCEGEVVQSMTFRGALRLRRRIEIPLGGTELRLRDRVDNIGPHPAPSMMLYHFNLGFPLVDADSRLVPGPAEELWQSLPHDPRAPFGPPSDSYQSEISVHRPQGPGLATCRLINPRRGLELSISFDVATLPCLQLLRLRGAGYYMAGIEPCTTVHRSRQAADQAGELPLLAPGESRDFALDISLARPQSILPKA
ncbi:aldose 1-epimerase family protein [Fluviibacterium sp. DFM31]|uniref:Aldose 1-epimerase family protein n=1 Tax=Meridianimarinicoccus marinus TaxID=3231483 RepID=A0ABV3LAR7_9RHOB